MAMGISPDRAFGLNDLEELPAKYDFIAEDISLDSHTAVTLRDRIQESLPSAHITSLRRFGNRSLWTSYQECKRRVAVDNGGDANVKLLFHGAIEPSRILGSGLACNCDGFDFRRSSGGNYGRGAYFAAEAAYPIVIYPRRIDPDAKSFQVIIAEVALGDVKDFQNDCDESLHMPPDKRPGLTYNSVCGTENSIGVHRSTSLLHGKQFVVYDRHQAYPHFLAVVQPNPLKSFMRVSIVFAEPDSDKPGTSHLRAYNGWRLSCHAHDESGDKRNGCSWKAMLHRPPHHGHCWKLEDAGDGCHRIAFAEPHNSGNHMHEYNGWELSCHAWTNLEHVNETDQRNANSWRVIMHKPGELYVQGSKWHFRDVGHGCYNIVLKTGDYDGWLLACHADANSHDTRNDDSWFVCLHSPDSSVEGDLGVTWRLSIVS